MRPYFFLSLSTSIVYLVIAYLLALISYSKGQMPPFLAILAIYGVSLLWPFALATFTKPTVAQRSNILSATKGTSFGMLAATILALLLLFAGNWNGLFQSESAIVVGLPIVFMGSTLLPYLALAKVSALKLIDPETRRNVLKGLSAPFNSFVILSLGVLTGAFPPRRVLVTIVNWSLAVLMFPLFIGWLIIARTIGLLEWLFPLIYYGLMFSWTTYNVRQIGGEGIQTLKASIRDAPNSPDASIVSELFFLVLVTILFIYLMIQVAVSPFF